MLLQFLGVEALSGCEDSGRLGLAGAALLGQEGSVMESHTRMRMANNTTRWEGQRTTTSNLSGQWMTQQNDNGGNNGGKDVVMLAVVRAGFGHGNESRQGEEEDAMMAGVVHANVVQNVTPHNPSLGLFLHHESIHNNTNN